ncbi:hypothetical protein [Roseospira goensis]|uniref:DUF2341 domain-containing protein n=1 Tax=Roseospira goensis TaxID=391922 RepID=A0A7W6WM35_9PROT|nr:hypothetical protein [Roseospira goensis]MBB4287519.1 hypothetical protein [Roseospira goensis]
MIGALALPTLTRRTSPPYPVGANFLRSPIVYTALANITDESDVGAGEIGTDSTYSSPPSNFVDGGLVNPMWNTRHQDMHVWVRTPAATDLSEIRIAYRNASSNHPGATGNLYYWGGSAWVFVSPLTYADNATLKIDTFGTVNASLFRLTYSPSPTTGWVGINEIEMYP